MLKDVSPLDRSRWRVLVKSLILTAACEASAVTDSLSHWVARHATDTTQLCSYVLWITMHATTVCKNDEKTNLAFMIIVHMARPELRDYFKFWIAH